MASHDNQSSTGSELLNPATDAAPDRNGAMVAATPVAAPPMFPGLGSQGPEILHGGINQTWLMNCLRRRWLLALCMGLLIGGAVAGVLLWCFPLSASTIAFIEVKPKADTDVLANSPQRLTQTEIEGQKYKHLSIVKSPNVLDAALKQRDDIAQMEAVLKEDDPSLWMFEELQVSFPNDGDYMEIRYNGEEDPAEMREIVQAIVDAYINEAQTGERQRKQDMIRLLKEKRDEITSNLKSRLRELTREKASAENSHSPSAETETRMLQTEIARLTSQIEEAKRELVEIEVAARVAYEEATSDAVIANMVQEELAQDPFLMTYQQQLFQIDIELQSLSGTSRNKNSGPIQRLRESKQVIRAQMEQHRQQRTAELHQQYKNMPNDVLQSVMVEKQIRQSAAMQRMQAYQKQIEEKTERLMLLTRTDPDIEYREHEVEADQESIAELTKNIESLEVQEVAGDRVRVMNNATTIEGINTIERFAIAGVGGLAAMLATCYAVALIEFRRRRLNGARDMDEGLNVRVLGVLPCTTARKSLAGGSLASAQVGEAIDNVRATLMHDSTSKRRQVVLVASPATMEGSTTVACNLAVSLARSGRRTLLVDGDLRAPALHKLFGLPLDSGLCEVLRSEIDVTDAVQASSSEGLYVLTAGACDMEAIHALATDLPQPIFDKLRAEFDFVVIDGAPILSLSDSLSIGQHVDGAILTVLRDHSEVRQIHRSIELLKDLGVDLIGSVVNGVPVKADRRIAQLHQASASRAKQLPAAATVAHEDADADIDIDGLGDENQE